MMDFDVLKRFWYSVIGLLRQPVTLLMIMISFILLLTHAKDPSTSIITALANKISSNQVVRQWIISSEIKIEGLLIFLPIVLSFRENKLFYALAFVLCWIALVPEHTVYQYICQALLLRVFLRAREDDDALRAFVIILAVFGALFANLTDIDFLSLANPTNNVTKRTR